MTYDKYCGTLTGKEVLVGGDNIVITFHSNGVVQMKGFLVYFVPVQPGK